MVLYCLTAQTGDCDMPNLDLDIAFWDYDRTRPLMDGRVRPEGINPKISVLRPRKIFPRMLQNQESTPRRCLWRLK